MSLKNRAVRRRIRVLLPLCGLLLLGLAACYPGGPENPSDTDMVVTSKVPDADYSGLSTFAMAQELVDLARPGDPVDPIDLPTQVLILNQIRAEMEAAGFQDVSPDTATVVPDVWLSAGAVKSQNFYYYYGWGGWWGGYGYPYPRVGSFTTGSVIWQAVRTNPSAPDERTGGLWLAGLNGVLSNSGTTDQARLTSNIHQAFVQSPYIQGTP